MWELLRQRWHVLPNDWKLAFVVLIFASIIFPLVWQAIKFIMKIPNMMYKHALIKMHDARIKWFVTHSGQAGAVPTEDEIIKLSGVWPWLAKRALRVQTVKIITADFGH